MRSSTLTLDGHRGPEQGPRPELRTLSIEDLVREVLAGKLRVPPFKRARKWDAHDALALLDSVYRGYPVGTLLLWETTGEADSLHYGSLEITAPDMSDAWWVVDGQQRVHSLTRVLAGKGLDSEKFALHFDLAHHQFVRLTRRSQETANHVPLTEVLDSERLRAWLRRPGTAVDDSLVIRLGKRIREYQLPVYIVRTPDEETIREIYLRVTGAGHPMDPREVFDAIPRASHGKRSDRSHGLSTALTSLGFGNIEGAMLPEAPLAHSQAPERAARSAIVLLRQDAGVPDRTLLPYDPLLLALTEFFRAFPEIHPRSRVLLARWVWRVALTEASKPGSVSSPHILHAISPGDEHGSVQALLAMVPRTPLIHLESRPFALSSTRCKIQMLALLDLAPRHLTTGAQVELRGGIKTLTRPIATAAPGAWKQDLANVLVHPTIPGGLRRALLKVEDPTILASHGLTPDTQDLLRRGYLSEFFAARCERLRVHVEAFTARRAAWNLPDRPPLSALEVGDED